MNGAPTIDGKLWSLQALRFWAALAVCFYHANEAVTGAGFRGALPPSLASAGQAGVDVFFVLSGFIIASTSKGLTPGRFAAKRAQRILPLWWLTSLPLLLAAGLQGHWSWRAALATMALWPATDVMTQPMSIGWTLCFEVLFYLAATLALWRRLMLPVLLAVFALAAMTRLGAVGQFLGNPLIAEFLLGVGLAHAPRWRPAVWLIPLAVVAMVLVAPALPDLTAGQLLATGGGWLRVLLFGVPAAAIVWGTLQIEARQGPLATLGDASYALYLLHPFAIIAVVALFGHATAIPGGLVLATAIGASVLISWLAWSFLEAPLLRAFRPRAVSPPVVRSTSAPPTPLRA